MTKGKSDDGRLDIPCWLLDILLPDELIVPSTQRPLSAALKPETRNLKPLFTAPYAHRAHHKCALR